jgi:hypothetical protein
VNVWQNTTLCDCDVTQELVQLLIIADGELEMTGNDTGFLVVTSGIAGKFEDFSSEVLKDGCEVDWSTGTDTLSVVALAEQTVDTTDWECETGFRGSAEMTCQSATRLGGARHGLTIERSWSQRLCRQIFRQSF